MTISRPNRLRKPQRFLRIVAATGRKGYIILGVRICLLLGFSMGTTRKHQHCQLVPMEMSPPTHSLHLDHIKILFTKISELLLVSYRFSPLFPPSFHGSIHIKALGLSSQGSSIRIFLRVLLVPLHFSMACWDEQVNGIETANLKSCPVSSHADDCKFIYIEL